MGDLFYGKVTFQWKKVKTLNFSGTFVACDLKVGRYRQHVELMKCCEYLMAWPFNFVKLLPWMLHAKFQNHRPFGSGEDF